MKDFEIRRETRRYRNFWKYVRAGLLTVLGVTAIAGCERMSREEAIRFVDSQIASADSSLTVRHDVRLCLTNDEEDGTRVIDFVADGYIEELSTVYEIVGVGGYYTNRSEDIIDRGERASLQGDYFGGYWLIIIPGASQKQIRKIIDEARFRPMAGLL